MTQMSKAFPIRLRLRQTPAGVKDVFEFGVRQRNFPQGGDICQLEKDGKVFMGIAVAPEDQKMGNKAVQTPDKTVEVSKAFADMHGLDFDGKEYVLRKTNEYVEAVEKVTLQEVGKDGALLVAPEDLGEDKKYWGGSMSRLLFDARYIAVGMPLDDVLCVGIEKCFRITQVTCNGKVLDHSDGRLYRFAGPSRVEIATGRSKTANGNLESRWALENSGLAGLDAQIAALRREMEKYRRPGALRKNYGVIIHGPGGTGKTTLIRKVAQAPWKKVFRPKLDVWKTNFPAQAEKCFSEASKFEPSLIVFDDKQAWFEHPIIVEYLDEGFETISQKQVLVLAASRNIRDVPKRLRKPGRFSKYIGTTVPDGRSRSKILKVLCTREQVSIPPFTMERLAANTHGYTGEDLEMLVDAVIDRAQTEENTVPPLGELRSSSASASTEMNRPASDLLVLSEKHFDTVLGMIRPSAMDEVFLETPKVSWEDVGGQQETKNALIRALMWPSKYTEGSKRVGTNASKGMLLFGPPGCSKTLTAAAVANETGLNFLAVKGAEVLSMYVGESERKVRDIFSRARAAQPSILFFDEIDAIGAMREHESNNVQVLTTILNEMDGIEALTGVFVLAATNKPWKLDPALLRHGRFNKHIYVPLPDEKTRIEIFNICMRKVESIGVKIEQLARDTDGCSGAEISSICQRAGESALERWVKMGRDAEACVEQQDFEEVLKDFGCMTSPESVKEYEEWASRIKNR